MKKILLLAFYCVATLVALAAFSTIPGASAGDPIYYVSSSTGSDSNNGLSVSAPFKSLTKVQSVAQSGDQIELLRGDTWTGGLTITADNVAIYGYGSASSRPKITGGVNGNCVTLKGNGDSLDNIDMESCGYAGVDLTGSSDVVKNAKAGGNSVGVHADTGSTGASVLNDTISGNNILNQNTSSGSSGAFGVLLNGNGATVSGNRIRGSSAASQAYGEDGSGVEIYNGSNNTIDHNLMTNDDAMSEWGGTGSGNLIAYNALSYNVTGVAVADGVVIQSGQGGTVEHNTIYLAASKGQGIVCSSCNSTLKDNVVYAPLKDLYTDGALGNVTGNVFDPVASISGDTQPAAIPGNKYAAVQLASPPTDLHETSTSPSIDLATTTPFSTDLDGNAVPQGNGPDSGAYEFNGAPPPPDTTPPSTPTNVTVGSATQTSLTLSWTASTDNVGVAGYHTFNGSTAAGDVTGTSKTFSGLTCGTTYTLGVSAFDAAGNTSSTATATGTTAACTAPDTTPPSTPTGLAVVAANGQNQASVTLSWDASNDNGGGDQVTGYNTFLNGAATGTVTGLSKTYTNLACGTTFTLGVQAVDQAGNVSGIASTQTTTSPCDTQAPSTPTGLTISNQTQTSLTLGWTASTDNVGVAGYDLFQGSASAGTTTSTSHTFTGLTCGTTYQLGVDAFDVAGNKSSEATASGTTSACSTGGPWAHIVWVLMENHGYSQIAGSSSAPYINSLMSQYGSATNYHALNHPSAPNYVGMTNGSNGSCCTDDGYHQLAGNSLFEQLPGGQSRSLEESMPSNCDTGNSGNYAIRHNPEPYYNDVRNSGDCAKYDVPLGSTPDLSAKFTFITPNVCHDMHSNSCSGSSNVILQGDNFLKGFVPQLLATPEYQAGNTVIFIVWDEDSGTSVNQVPLITIDPNSPHTTGCAGTNWNHWSLLRYAEDNFGLTPLGGAATAAKLNGCFGL